MKFHVYIVLSAINEESSTLPALLTDYILNGKRQRRHNTPAIILNSNTAQPIGAFAYKSSAVAEMGDRLATIGMDRKWGGATVGGWVPTGSPSNTVWPEPRPTTLPSGILIHPTVGPQ